MAMQLDRQYYDAIARKIAAEPATGNFDAWPHTLHALPGRSDAVAALEDLRLQEGSDTSRQLQFQIARWEVALGDVQAAEARVKNGESACRQQVLEDPSATEAHCEIAGSLAWCGKLAEARKEMNDAIEVAAQQLAPLDRATARSHPARLVFFFGGKAEAFIELLRALPEAD